MNINILVVEDEFPIALDIKTRLEKLNYKNIFMALTYKEAVQIIKKETINIALLDINLNGTKTGIDLGVLIKENYAFPVLYITAYSNDTTFEQALEAEPMGYISKPFKDIDLQNNIKLALNHYREKNVSQLTENNNHLFIKEKGILYQIALDEILYIEAMDNYSIIYLKNKKYIINTLLKDVLIKTGKQFLRIHKSYAIALDKVTKIEDNLIFIEDKYMPIGPKYKADVIKTIRLL